MTRRARPADTCGLDTRCAFLSIADGQRVNLMDSGTAPTSIADAAFNDAAINLGLAQAETSALGPRYAYLGSRAPAFTDAMRTAVRDAVTADRQRQATSVRDGATVQHAETVALRAVRDEATAKRKIETANAWRR